ncbi:MAG: hypothetical protein JNM91_00350, partial [Flavobacteriales bacterium]|nr:hypothetical protein [Flavobacteriales bacterium]
MNTIARLVLTTSLLTPVLATRAQTPTHQYVQQNTVGSNGSMVNSVATDGEGSLIVCGSRLDTLDFGGNNHPAGTGGIFVAKFDQAGEELWCKVAGN